MLSEKLGSASERREEERSEWNGGEGWVKGGIGESEGERGEWRGEGRVKGRREREGRRARLRGDNEEWEGRRGRGSWGKMEILTRLIYSVSLFSSDWILSEGLPYTEVYDFSFKKFSKVHVLWKNIVLFFYSRHWIPICKKNNTY